MLSGISRYSEILSGSFSVFWLYNLTIGKLLPVSWGCRNTHQHYIDFYMWLGCRHLSSVVHEEYKVLSELPSTKTATELLFWKGFRCSSMSTCTRTMVSFSWLSKPENFKVRVFGKLTIVKTLASGNWRGSAQTLSNITIHYHCPHMYPYASFWYTTGSC